jgi:hypothetical protein
MSSVFNAAMALCFGFGLAAGASNLAAAEPGCAATVFFDANFGGPSRTLYGTVGFVGHRWNDQISAIIVHSGYWAFYQDAGFQGESLKLGPGQYPFVGNRWNDQISSAQCVAP